MEKETITKKQLIRLIAELSGETQSTTRNVLEKFFYIVPKILRKGEIIEIRNFGQFKLIERKERKARIITQDKSIMIPEHKELTFKFSKHIRKIF